MCSEIYDAGVIPRFGEMMFYPGSGLDPINPSELDQELGRYRLSHAIGT